MNNRERRKRDDVLDMDDDSRFKTGFRLSIEDVRPCDLKVCLACNQVQYVGDLEVEKRRPGLFASSAVHGVFCPNCEQMLFDADEWQAHVEEQRAWDAKNAKEGERTERSDPLGGRAAAAVEGNDSELIEEMA